ncbi:unnamed protein product [Lactuca saligna]|uniref:Uncharacterized protein n=1 Tax=Lactuca saligna TaxID=75948 RepID=A0AA36E1G2_LACSI|nr:unnamed protein product [Lactuca saligna]
MVLLATKLEFLVYEILLSKGKPYKNNREILAMINLIAAYQGNEILEFEKILKNQVLLNLIKPYPRIRSPFISKRDPNLFYTVSVTGVEEGLYKGSNDPIGGT